MTPVNRPIQSKSMHNITRELCAWFLGCTLPIHNYIQWGCRSNAVNFHPNPHKRHPIVRPWGRGMGCLLWESPLMHILPQSISYHIYANSGYFWPRHNGIRLKLLISRPTKMFPLMTNGRPKIAHVINNVPRTVYGIILTTEIDQITQITLTVIQCRGGN